MDTVLLAPNYKLLGCNRNTRDNYYTCITIITLIIPVIIVVIVNMVLLSLLIFN